ncbi:MAG: tRNA (5-methylaminomethyl-2-thiouridine)(34)-methyltransferase MnmD [Cohaesibacter sp.]|nr:tRNA (5-methylaminomethyl-2-thiouridine)(34)-methyltransferase MnmD [Cohaesibacter sp.]
MAEQAELSWLDNLTPISTRFDDSYYSRQDGLSETRYVFIEGNALTTRWQKDESPIIGELGFGTGLNFLATWQAFSQRNASSTNVTLNASHEDKYNSEQKTSQRLTFCSFEKYPMSGPDLQKALSPWHDLHPLPEHLLTQWQNLKPGWNNLIFDAAQLYLFIGEAMDGLSSLPADLRQNIAAWYLDGFNPKTNPDLWSLPLLQAVYEASQPGASFATYTAAGWVRRNLQQAGFEVKKRKGFGHKRDMCHGIKSNTHQETGSSPCPNP